MQYELQFRRPLCNVSYLAITVITYSDALSLYYILQKFHSYLVHGLPTDLENTWHNCYQCCSVELQWESELKLSGELKYFILILTTVVFCAMKKLLRGIQWSKMVNKVSSLPGIFKR